MSNIFCGDIRVRDSIKVTTVDRGVLVERSGTVGNCNTVSGGIAATDGGPLWDPGWAGKFSFELLDRPKPQLPTKEGTLIIAKNMKYEEPEVILIHRARAWETLDGQSVYRSAQIAEWALVNLVEVSA